MNGANWVSDMRVSLGLGCDGGCYLSYLIKLLCESGNAIVNHHLVFGDFAMQDRTLRGDALIDINKRDPAVKSKIFARVCHFLLWQRSCQSPNLKSQDGLFLESFHTFEPESDDDHFPLEISWLFHRIDRIGAQTPDIELVCELVLSEDFIGERYSPQPIMSLSGKPQNIQLWRSKSSKVAWMSVFSISIYMWFINSPRWPRIDVIPKVA